MAASVVAVVLLVWLAPALVLGAVALVHRLTLPPVDPLVLAAGQVEAEADRAAGIEVVSTEVHGPSGCSMTNPGCPSVTVTTRVDATSLELAVASVSDAVTAAGFGDVDGSLWAEADDSRCCYLAVVDGHEVTAQVTRSQLPPPSAGQHVEVRVAHLDGTTASHMDR